MIDVAAEFAPVLGRPSWNVEQGYGSFVTMQFGEPRLDVSAEHASHVEFNGVPGRPVRRRAHLRGQWQLWIRYCQWSLLLHDVQVAEHERSGQANHRALDHLDGQWLTGVHVDDGALTTFTFDLGCVLRTWPAPLDDYDGDAVELWDLFKPDGQVLTLRRDGLVSLGPGARTIEQRGWEAPA